MNFQSAYLQISSDVEASSEDLENLETFSEKASSSDTHSKAKSKSANPIFFHLTILCIYTILLLLSLHWLRKERLYGAGVVHTPARSALIYEPLIYDIPINITSPYVGDPRPELDLAWHKLLKNTNIRIPAEEMIRLGRLKQGIMLPGGGYFASLMVYHQLHCIKRLHHSLYPDHYFPNMTEREKNLNKYHNKHCLDIIRQAIQCQGDASLLTMKWGKNDAVPLGNFTMPHECVNWERLNSWAGERSFDAFTEGTVVHPTLGPAYPNGMGNHLGVGEGE